MSGRKNALPKFQIISAGAMVGDLTSTVTNIENLDNIGIQANITAGTPTGTLAVQVSGDYSAVNGVVLVAGNWVTLTTQAITAGSPANTYFDLNQLSSMWIRLIYTHSSSTGSLDAFILGKMI